MSRLNTIQRAEEPKIEVPDIQSCIRLLLLSAIVYLLFDLPVQLTGFLRFGQAVGIKNFLPPVLGLFMGPWGAIGGSIGCLISGLILGGQAREVFAECLWTGGIGMGMWLCWHFRKKSANISFKQGCDYLYYAGLLAALAAAWGAVTLFFAGGRQIPVLFVSHFFMGTLVGIPVSILLGSVFCIQPIQPSFCGRQEEISGVVDASYEGLKSLNDRLEEAAWEKQIKRARVFETQSCVEEISIRVLQALPDAQIRLSVVYGDAISIRFFYGGGRYNPLHGKKEEDELDLMGLRLIRHRALRARYGYRRKENSLHIVL